MEREYVREEASLPGKAGSIWIDTAEPTAYPSLTGVHETEIAIVGAGIAGVVTAALLKEAGRDVTLLEARGVGLGATGHTTAKATIEHHLVCHELVENVSEDAARAYLQANVAGLHTLRRLVEQYHVRCNWHPAPFYVYAGSTAELRRVRKEHDALRGFGVDVALEEGGERPFPVEGALRVNDQAQFHPLRFLTRLLDALPTTVYERSRVLEIEDGDPCRLVTAAGEVRAKHVVIATHFPVYDHGGFFSRLFPYTAYALGARIRSSAPEGMYHSTSEPDHAMRHFEEPDDRMLVVSGESHKTGQGGDERDHYRALEHHSREHYDVESLDYRWSTEDYYTPDSIPFVGASPGSDRIFLATGFGGWGMTNGAAAAVLLTDLLSGRDNPWAETFRPSRTGIKASWRDFLKENANVAKAAVGGKLSGGRHLAPEQMPAGEGAIVEHEGRRSAVYRESDGVLHVLGPSCTHLGCEVTFNEADKTWDCPCHGSRYDGRGEPVDGPAIRPLKRRE